MLLPRFQNRTSGFTLTECLVVTSIIGTLAVLLFPVANRAINNAKLPTSLSNIRQAGNAIIQYAVDNNNCLPWAYGYSAENAPNWVMALRESGFSNIVGNTTPGPKHMMCPLAQACRPAATKTLGRMFAMNYFASNRVLASFETSSQTALLMNGRWNPSAKNWNQTEIGTSNARPNHLPDFPYPVRSLSNTDHPQANADNPSTVVFFLDGRTSLVNKSDFPDPAISENTSNKFWDKK